MDQTLVTNDGTPLKVLGGPQLSAASNAITNNGNIALGGGTFSGPGLVNNPGSTLAGTGTFSPTGGVTVGSGVDVSPGVTAPNSFVGSLAFNSLNLGAGGAYSFDLMNASGTAGTWGTDTLSVAGTANDAVGMRLALAIDVRSINTGTGAPGLASFNSSQSYQWTLLSAASVTNFNAADFSLDLSGFTNGLGGGTFSLSANSSDIFLNFTPVPEPSSWALLGAGLAGVALMGLRRRRAAPVVR